MKAVRSCQFADDDADNQPKTFFFFNGIKILADHWVKCTKKKGHYFEQLC
jgi:hypothetical protein